MNKKRKLLLLVLAAAMLLSGCMMRTVDQLYCLPKRPQVDDNLQTVIDKAMSGLSYSAPVYGENRQVLQPADLDGDGINEYVVMARAGNAKSLKILIFRQLAMGYELADTIDGFGSAFDFIRFENTDDHPGVEIIVGRQFGDGVARSAAVYRYSEGKTTQLLEVNYSQFLSCDMDEDGRSELMVIHPGDSADVSGTVELYRYEGNQLHRSGQLALSSLSGNIKRMDMINLENGQLGVLVASTKKNTQMMEIFAYQSGALQYLYGSASVEKLNDHFVDPCDVDGNGSTDLPELIPIRTADGTETGEYWVFWYGVDGQGQKIPGMYTYYNYADKWYLHIDQNWTKKMTVTKSESSCTFTNTDKQIVMTIYALTGSNRKEQAQTLGGTVLGSSATVTFVAVTGPGANALQITEQRIKQMFYPIELKLYTEET